MAVSAVTSLTSSLGPWPTASHSAYASLSKTISSAVSWFSGSRKGASSTHRLCAVLQNTSTATLPRPLISSSRLRMSDDIYDFSLSASFARLSKFVISPSYLVRMS